MTSQHKTGTHPFLRQASIRPVLIHFYDKPAEDQYSSFFMTSWQKTGAHPFYIGMYIHIYTHIYVHIYTSQKECLHIFMGVEHHDKWSSDIYDSFHVPVYQYDCTVSKPAQDCADCHFFPACLSSGKSNGFTRGKTSWTSSTTLQDVESARSKFADEDGH